MSYLWTGSLNGIKLQLWGTWLFYAVLVDLGDAVADEVSLPFDRISLEMIYRGLYHFYVAHHKGLATDPIKYFSAPENKDLGIVKSIRKPFKKLIIDPFIKRQRHWRVATAIGSVISIDRRLSRQLPIDREIYSWIRI